MLSWSGDVGTDPIGSAKAEKSFCSSFPDLFRTDTETADVKGAKAELRVLI